MDDIAPGIDTKALEALKHKIDELPMLPQVLVRILQVRTTDDDYFEQIERLATEDPPFAVRLITLANSAGSSAVSPIKSVRDALTRVGAVTITSLVASLAVQRVFVPSSPSHIGLWAHSIQVAVCAETIARLAPSLKVSTGEAYLAGLLHDIGRFVMFEHAPDELLKVDEANWGSPDELIAADVEVFKFTHAQLGFLACSRWSLPSDIAEVVRRHHQPLSEPISAGSIDAAVLCVVLGDRLSMLLDPQDADKNTSAEWARLIEEKCLLTQANKILVDPHALAGQVDGIIERSEQLMAGLGIAL